MLRNWLICWVGYRSYNKQIFSDLLDVDLPEITGLPGSTSGLLSTSEIGSLLQPRGEDKLPNVDELPDVDVTRPSKLQIQDLIPTGEVGGDDGGEFDRLMWIVEQLHQVRMRPMHWQDC